MVHALRQAHRLLHPGGLLINIQDLPVPHVIEVHAGKTVITAGWLLEREGFKDERAALNALSHLVSKGEFQLQNEKDFQFRVYFDELGEFLKRLDEDWKAAVVPDKTIQRLSEIIGQSGAASKVVLNTPTRMTSLTRR